MSNLLFSLMKMYFHEPQSLFSDILEINNEENNRSFGFLYGLQKIVFFPLNYSIIPLIWQIFARKFKDITYDRCLRQ